MDKTCAFYAPPAAEAETHRLKPGKTHRFLQLFDSHTCWNTQLGASNDRPTVCAATGQMPACPGYRPEPDTILARRRQDRGVELPIGMRRYVVIDAVQTRMGVGVETIQIVRTETDSHLNLPLFEDGLTTIPFTFSSYANNGRHHELAQQALADQCAGGAFEKVTPPAVHDEAVSYFATIAALHEQRVNA